MKNDWLIVAEQQPGIVTFDNYEEFKIALKNYISSYSTVDYANANIEDTKNDLKELKHIKKVLTDAKKSLEEGYNAPFVDVKNKIDELIDIVKEPLNMIDGIIKEKERSAKEQDILTYAQKQSEKLGSYAEKITKSPVFFNDKWLNVTYREKQWREDIDAKIQQAVSDLETIQAVGGRNQSALLARYYETLSLDGAKEFLDIVEAENVDEDLQNDESEDLIKGFKVLKIYGSERQMAQLITQIDLLGLEYDELEDGMPKEQEELTVPDFDTFVAFDIETTGTFGVGNGDAPAEITEIGAVKVVNGQVVERFDMLCNPGRKIVPRIARLTHITDEMVKNEPPVDEVIRNFAEFIDGFVLVGHNIKNSDLHYISKVAKRAGVILSSPFFDTYLYAKKFKERQGWENVKLEYLSKQFGISQPDAHRAWCDAVANVDVYFKLKEIR